MDKRYSQLELFNEGQSQSPVRDDSRRRPFIFQVNRYEKTLFLLIGFVVTGATFYCLGVERGKAMALSRMNQGFDLARGKAEMKSAPAVPAQPVPAVPAVAIPGGVRPPASATLQLQPSAVTVQTKADPMRGRETFTIQIGTYREYKAALRERDKLVSKGLSARVFKKGAYSVVVVGNFRDKEAASSVMSKLRRSYRDCYVRRL